MNLSFFTPPERY
jgi:hypothetical protein